MSSIPNYVRPQDTITLVKEFVVNGNTPRKLPVVIGVQYDLFRYGQETIPGVAYTTFLEFTLKKDVDGVATALGSGVVVDETSLEVYGEDLIALSAEQTTGTYAFRLDDLSRPQRIRIKGAYNLAGTSLLPALNDRAVAIGDPVLVDDGVGGSTFAKRKVTGFLGRSVDASAGTNEDKDDETFAVGLFNPISGAAGNTLTAETWASAGGSLPRVTIGGTAWGRSGTARSLGALNASQFAEVYTVRALGAKSGAGVCNFSITSASGKFDVASVASTNSSGAFVISHANLNGVTLTINATVEPQLGDVFVIRTIGDYDRTDVDWFGVTGTYSGEEATTFVVTVTAGDNEDTDSHTLTIHDTSGLYTPVVFTGAISTTQNIAVMGGLTISVLAANIASYGYGLRTGDTFYIHASPTHASTEEFNGLILDGPAVDTTLFTSTSTDIPTVQLGMSVAGLIDTSWSAEPWTYNSATREVTMGALAVDNGYGEDIPILTGHGKVFGSFRAAVTPGALEGMQIAGNTNHLLLVGANDPDNDLGFAVHQEFSGSQAMEVAYLRTATYEPAALAAAYRKIEATDRPYEITPMVQDSAGRLQALAHVEAMSVPTKKNFRKTYLGIDSPGRYKVLYRQSNNQTYTATVGSYTGGYTLVTFLQDIDLVALNVRAGDEIVMPVAGVTTTVVEVLSATELVIADALNSAVSPPGTPIELWKPDTPENTIDYLKAAAAELSSFRAVLVWCEGGYRGLTPIASRYIAAEIAGLRSAVAPQIGITQVELRTVTSATPMYVRYTAEQLDELSAAGVFVVTQEESGGPVFVRHQLTTETAAGILAWEDSVGMNHDFLAFGLKAITAKYRQGYNRTEDTRREIEDDIHQYSMETTKSDLGDVNGPQTVNFRNRAGENGKVTVETDPDFADRFRYFVDYGVPVPLNGINGTIRIHLGEAGI